MLASYHTTLPSDDGVPKWVHLIPAGTFMGSDGRGPFHLRDAEAVCDRFALLADGRIRGTGTLAELRAKTGGPQADLEDIFLALT